MRQRARIIEVVLSLFKVLDTHSYIVDTVPGSPQQEHSTKGIDKGNYNKHLQLESWVPY